MFRKFTTLYFEVVVGAQVIIQENNALKSLICKNFNFFFYNFLAIEKVKRNLCFTISEIYFGYQK